MTDARSHLSSPPVSSPAHDLEELRSRVAGQLHTPTDPTWEAARQPWLRSVEQRPLAVLDVRDRADVQAAVRWAADNDVQVIAQPVGHGASDPLEGVLVLRTRGLTGIGIDVAARTALVGAGVKSGELLGALEGTGLTFLAGSNPDTTVVGLTLGGGMSWFGRAYGLGADSIRRLEVVDGLGRVRTVDRDREPDLFWAMRGGGGDFGIVTRLELGLHPAPAVYGGRLLWPLARMGEVLRAFRAVTEAVPPELTLWFHAYQFPPLSPVPEELRGRSFASVAFTYLGTRSQAEPWLAPVRAVPGMELDLTRDVPLGDLGSIAAEPTDPAPSLDFSTLLSRLDDGAIDRLTELVTAGPHPLAVLQIRHLGAAFAKSGPDSGCAAPIVEPYLLYAVGMAATPELRRAIEGFLPLVHDAASGASTGHTVPNFLPAGGDVSTVWPDAVRRRLGQIKAETDPLSTIRSNRPVLAARG